MRWLLCAVALTTVGCLDESPGEVGEGSSAIIPVTWTDVVGASAAGNDLTKTAPETAWNAGAVSVETLSNDGFVQFTTDEATTFKMAGLSSGNEGQGQADVDFAIRLSDTGRVAIFEGGINRAAVGTYAAGDVFRVQVLGGVVTYWRNGSLLYTSAGTPSFPLLVDTSLFTPGATIRDAAVQSLLFWENVVGAQAIGDDLSKTGIATAWDAGATSIASIPAGDGYIEFGAADTTTMKAAGLSNGNGNQSRGDIDFAISLDAAGGVSVFEGGTLRGHFGSYTASDLFQIQVESGVVTYFKNRQSFFTSSATPGYPLLLDTSLRTPGARIVDARLSFGPLPDCAPFEQSFTVPGTGGPYPMDAGGDVLVVGDRSVGAGRAIVYRQTAGGWALEQTLTVPGSAYFGGQVATDGETIAVVGSTQVGSGLEAWVQLYRHDGTEWVDDGVLEGCPSSYFGDRVAVEGGTVVVAANQDVPPWLGQVYVFRRGSAAWKLQAFLVPSDQAPGDYFGSSLALGRDRVFVGASGKDTQASEAGAIYVFRRDPTLPPPDSPPTCWAPHAGTWVQEEVLYASNGQARGWFGVDGMDATADGLLLIAGNGRRDSANVFRWSGGWQETAVLRPTPAKNWFGVDVALGEPAAGGTVAVVGSEPTYYPGSAFVFTELEGVWRQIDFSAAPEAGGDDYGRMVAAAADTIFVGDALDGAAYEFEVHPLDPVCLGE